MAAMQLYFSSPCSLETMQLVFCFTKNNCSMTTNKNTYIFATFPIEKQTTANVYIYMNKYIRYKSTSFPKGYTNLICNIGIYIVANKLWGSTNDFSLP